MSEYSDELGAWWTEFPGSDRAARATSSPSVGGLAPAPDGVRGAGSRRAFKHGLVLTPGRHERARHEAAAEWRRQRVAAIRQPSLKSGVITVGSGFGGTGKTDVAVTLPDRRDPAPELHGSRSWRGATPRGEPCRPWAPAGGRLALLRHAA